MACEKIFRERLREGGLRLTPQREMILAVMHQLDGASTIDAGSDQHRYELLGVHGPHLHLACQSCGKVIGVSLAEAEPFVAHLRAAYGFEAELDNVTIPGLCEACRSAAGQRLASAV